MKKSGGVEMKVCVLIPAYNEGGRIGRLVERILTLKEIADVIVVDDGSTDSTYEEAKRVGAIVLKHERNVGKGAAIRTGFSYLQGKKWRAVITMDGDGQHDYRELPHFVEAFKKGASDIILGSRMHKCEDMPLIRYLTNRFTSFVTSLLGKCRVTDSQSGFRLISTDVINQLSLSSCNFEIESEVIIKGARRGFRIAEIPISTIYLPDSVKKSKIHPLIDTLRFFRLAIRSLRMKGEQRRENV
ncbi:MAG TPA: glycosyltransferase family 2 protein [Candidatus Omnitrophica bacterium]|nr:glycosyltransferase family 2 protein [Candidatus Omnitrophota bacterium]